MLVLYQTVMQQYGLTMQSSIKDLYNATRQVNMRAGANRKEAQNNIYNKGARDWNARVNRLSTGGNSGTFQNTSAYRNPTGY